MTEEQAIERIARAMGKAPKCQEWTGPHWSWLIACDDDETGPDVLARMAWNEMKAIAREDTTTLRFYTGKAVNGSDGKELIL